MRARLGTQRMPAGVLRTRIALLHPRSSQRGSRSGCALRGRVSSVRPPVRRIGGPMRGVRGPCSVNRDCDRDIRGPDGDDRERE